MVGGRERQVGLEVGGRASVCLLIRLILLLLLLVPAYPSVEETHSCEKDI